MTAGAWGTFVALAVVSAGCRGPKHYEAPLEVLPPPANRGGTEIVIHDARPEWEKKPFVGAISLYHPGKVRPSPWDQLAAEAAKVAAEMGVKPDRVTVVVTSLRLVRLDENRVDGEMIKGNYDLVPGVSFRWFTQKPETLYPKAVTEHPHGASCAIEATIKVEGVAKNPTFEVKTIAGGPGLTGTAYRGDVMDQPVRHAVFQFGREFRSAVGLPPDG